MANKEAIKKVEEDIQLLEKMQSLSFFETIDVKCDRRVTRVPGGWIYGHIVYHNSNTVPTIQSVFVNDKDANLVFNINVLKDKLEDLRLVREGRGR